MVHEDMNVIMSKYCASFLQGVATKKKEIISGSIWTPSYHIQFQSIPQLNFVLAAWSSLIH